jgi:hypothetical protein
MDTIEILRGFDSRRLHYRRESGPSLKGATAIRVACFFG